MSLAADIIQKVTNAASKLGDTMEQSVGTAAEFVRKNPVTSAATIGGGLVAGGTVVQIVRSRSKKSSKYKAKSKKKSKRSKRKITHTKRGWKADRARRSKQSWEVAYQRGKKSKSKHTKKKVGKTYYTKNGQPYKILASGKAKFIKGRRKK